MFNFLNSSNKEKLYNLAESIVLDDYLDDDDTTFDIGQSKTTEIKDYDIRFNDFINKRILNLDESEIDEFELGLIDRINNDTTDKYTGAFVVNSFSELKTALKRGFKYFKENGNYNWINTGNITSMLRLFKAALDTNVKKFNGDISKWDVSNVENMLYIFLECNSLTCDISNWDMSKVKHWNRLSYCDTPKVFLEICKNFNIKNHVLWPEMFGKN